MSSSSRLRAALLGTLLLAAAIAGSTPSSAAPSWSSAGELNLPRGLHSAVLLLDGSVLVAGGRGCPRGASISTSSEILPAGGSAWTLTSPMVIARDRHATALLLDGRVLVVGGQATAGVCQSRAHAPIGQFAEIYDPADGTWSLTGVSNGSRINTAAITLRDGRVLLAAGDGYRTAEIFDPRTETWTATGNAFTIHPSPTTALLHDGRVLLMGGVIGPAEIYDPDTGTWSVAAYPGMSLLNHASAVLPDGRVLVTGGGSGSVTTAARIYDPAADAWAVAAPMSVGRAYHSLTTLYDGRVLAAGGSTASGLPIASAEVYDPVADSWTTLAGMPSGHTSHVAVRTYDGSVLIISGGYETIGFNPSVQRFTP